MNTVASIMTIMIMTIIITDTTVGMDITNIPLMSVLTLEVTPIVTIGPHRSTELGSNQITDQ